MLTRTLTPVASKTAKEPRTSAPSSDKWIGVVIHLFLAGFGLACLFPFWLVVINSFASESSLAHYGLSVWPRQFGLASYEFIFKGDQLLKSYGVTLFVTAAGTAISLAVTATLAYALAHPKAKYGNLLSLLVYLPMIFGTGLVGFYLLIVNWLDLKDSIWSLILPYAVNPFLAFLFVAFYRTLPFEINESAMVEGANEWQIFFRIIRPITTPIIATVGLFYALQYWNDWWLGLLFIDNSDLYPLQILLRQIMGSVDALKFGANYGVIPPTDGLKLSMVCMTIGPIIFAYPFLQRYFVKGITVGAVKG